MSTVLPYLGLVMLVADVGICWGGLVALTYDEELPPDPQPIIHQGCPFENHVR